MLQKFTEQVVAPTNFILSSILRFSHLCRPFLLFTYHAIFRDFLFSFSFALLRESVKKRKKKEKFAGQSLSAPIPSPIDPKIPSSLLHRIFKRIHARFTRIFCTFLGIIRKRLILSELVSRVSPSLRRNFPFFCPLLCIVNPPRLPPFLIPSLFQHLRPTVSFPIRVSTPSIPFLRPCMVDVFSGERESAVARYIQSSKTFSVHLDSSSFRISVTEHSGAHSSRSSN